MTTVNGNFTVTVKPAQSALAMNPQGGNLPGEQLGTADAGDLVCQISGGQPFDKSVQPLPYNISVSQGTLPPGMGLSSEVNADGSMSVFIEGTPTQSGAFSFTVSAQDAAGASVSTAATRTPNVPASQS